MLNSKNNYLTAEVALPSTLPLAKTAEQLSHAISGFTFVEENTGRFEEVPAFISWKNGCNFTLFGIPVNEVSDCYILEFTCNISICIDEFKKNAPEFLRQFISEKEVNESGYLDYSEELGRLLQSKGFVLSEL